MHCRACNTQRITLTTSHPVVVLRTLQHNAIVQMIWQSGLKVGLMMHNLVEAVDMVNIPRNRPYDSKTKQRMVCWMSYIQYIYIYKIIAFPTTLGQSLGFWVSWVHSVLIISTD